MSVLLTLLDFGCASQRLEVREPPARPFDAVIVPGCPSARDGTLTRCQARRAMWATILWERGYAHHFITSGSAVHSPFVEAEAIAAAMSAFGVPADRIYLEPEALHTDENIYNGLQLAQLQGWHQLGVASDRGQALGACQMLEDWHRQCGSFSMDYTLVEQRLQAAHTAGIDLARIRAPMAATFMPLAQRERERARAAGRSGRPPSFVLYPLMFFRRKLGRQPWRPFAPAAPVVMTWATRIQHLSPPPAP